MLQILEFVFQSFWTFAGSVILLAVAVSPFYSGFAVLGALLARR